MNNLSVIKPNTNNGQMNSYKVHHVRMLSPTAFIVRFDRKHLQFTPGQYVSVGVENDQQAREYSIYSAVDDPYLEILVKEVENGIVSKRLRKLKAGDILRVNGPMGSFANNISDDSSFRLFVASGSGISPFHSIVKSGQLANYQLVHGVKSKVDAYESSTYSSGKYVLCTSREKSGDFNGRVSDYLRKQQLPQDTQAYLCGNCDMIFEVYDILTDKGISVENIHSEVYF